MASEWKLVPVEPTEAMVYAHDEYLTPSGARAARVVIRDAIAAAPQPDTVVPEMDDEVRWILGRPNFTCIQFAQYLRSQGREIANKAEHEQAEAIHWMLGLYAKHGAGWREEARALLDQERPRKLKQSYCTCAIEGSPCHYCRETSGY